MIKWIIVALYLGSILYVHFRGKVRLRFWRQMLDHSAVVAPVNCFMYAFSGVPQTPYVPVDRFPDLQKLQAAWPQIRDEALALIDLCARSRPPTRTTTPASTPSSRMAGSAST